MPIGRERRATAVTSATEATALANARLNAVVTERVGKAYVTIGQRKRLTRSARHFSFFTRARACGKQDLVVSRLSAVDRSEVGVAWQ